jgi:hypothetical protein
MNLEGDLEEANARVIGPALTVPAAPAHAASAHAAITYDL